MPAHLLEGHLQLPAHHKPTYDLLRVSIEVCTQQSLGFERSFGIADQDPTDGHGEQARGVPHGCCRSDLDHALPAAVPVGDLGRLPNGVRLFGYLRKVGQPLALEARPPPLPRTTWRSRFVEGAIQPQTGDEGHRLAQRSTARKQLQRGVGAVGYGHYLALWGPPPYHQEHLPGPLGYLLVSFAPLCGITLGGSKSREEGQSPYPRSPGDLHQQHRANPSEAAALDELFVSGTDRISVDAPG